MCVALSPKEQLLAVGTVDDAITGAAAFCPAVPHTPAPLPLAVSVLDVAQDASARGLP